MIICPCQLNKKVTRVNVTLKTNMIDSIMQGKSCNESDNEDSNFQPQPPKATFIVFWSSLLMLLRQCLHPTSFLPAKIKNFSLKGCQLIVSSQCSDEILVFGNPNQTVIAFLLVIWWVMQPYFLAWMLAWELQVFPSWQKLSGFWKQVTMKLKKKKISRHSKPKLFSTFRRDFDDSEKKG